MIVLNCCNQLSSSVNYDRVSKYLDIYLFINRLWTYRYIIYVHPSDKLYVVAYPISNFQSNGRDPHLLVLFCYYYDQAYVHIVLASQADIYNILCYQSRPNCLIHYLQNQLTCSIVFMLIYSILRCFNLCSDLTGRKFINILKFQKKGGYQGL